MIRPHPVPMALAAALAACGTPHAGTETATWQQCRSEARMHAASQPPGLPQPTALTREQAYLQSCLSPVLR